MIPESTRISRSDIWLDDNKFDGFLVRCVQAGNTVSDLFLGTELFLEPDGTVVLEYNLENDTLYYETFAQDEWGPSEKADEATVRMFNRVRTKTTAAEVYDIFTGLKIDPNKREVRFGERLRAKIAELDSNAF